ncbi:Protein kinase domain [Dillenia turbinata]|uniref:Protein kinase domain n=1 Tax=Dillenia turbinata TaxID=194707 RepID=A0AAN8ZWT9_9MAGN
MGGQGHQLNLSCPNSPRSCQGGELLDRILSRDGIYAEEDAKVIVKQILSVVAFCHLQRVVHHDLEPKNFLFTTRNEDAFVMIIDFGLSDFARSHNTSTFLKKLLFGFLPSELELLLGGKLAVKFQFLLFVIQCGSRYVVYRRSRPFWARAESGIFRSVLRADPNSEDSPWPSASPEAKDFVRRLRNKDYRKRMSAAQALKLMLMVQNLHGLVDALSKALTEDELVYLRAQFRHLEPNKKGQISFDNFRVALTRNVTDAMKELSLEEFCAAAISTHLLEALDYWEEMATTAFENFELKATALSLWRNWQRPQYAHNP